MVSCEKINNLGDYVNDKKCGKGKYLYKSGSFYYGKNKIKYKFR